MDGCEILHHQKDGWNPVNNGMLTTYQLLQDFATVVPLDGPNLWVCELRPPMLFFKGAMTWPISKGSTLDPIISCFKKNTKRNRNVPFFFTTKHHFLGGQPLNQWSPSNWCYYQSINRLITKRGALFQQFQMMNQTCWLLRMIYHYHWGLINLSHHGQMNDYNQS